MMESMTYRCIKPQCPNDCCQCNHAVSRDDDAALIVVELLDTFAVDGHGGLFEDGECALVDRARAWLADRGAVTSEIERLTCALKKANDHAERFERGWYLRGDALQSIDAIATRCIGEPVTAIEDELIRIGTKCRAGLDT